MAKKLVFGDPEMISKLQGNRPHIEERDTHSCNCEFCEMSWEAESYRCSVCKKEEDDESDFYDSKKEKYRCKSCWNELLTIEELENIKENKIKAYTLLPKDGK